jgi:hypothetical protein
MQQQQKLPLEDHKTDDRLQNTSKRGHFAQNWQHRLPASCEVRFNSLSL